MVTIRRAKKTDIPGVAKLWVEMMEEHAERDPRFSFASNAEESYVEYALGLVENNDTAFFLAEQDDSLIGYTLAMVLDNPPVFVVKKYGFVGEMVVSRTHREAGIGKLLWDRTKGWFRRKGVRVAQLNVSVVNIPGQAFWRSVGFENFLEVKWCDLEASENP